MCGAAANTADLLVSSANVIKHRNQMMTDAFNGKAPFNQKEFMAMWQEKINAGSESWGVILGLLLNSGKKIPVALSEKTIKAHMKNYTEIMRPYHTKVTANAKRLSKR